MFAATCSGTRSSSSSCGYPTVPNAHTELETFCGKNMASLAAAYLQSRQKYPLLPEEQYSEGPKSIGNLLGSAFGGEVLCELEQAQEARVAMNHVQRGSAGIVLAIELCGTVQGGNRIDFVHDLVALKCVLQHGLPGCLAHDLFVDWDSQQPHGNGKNGKDGSWHSGSGP